jgi:hypothetical protein
LTHKVPKWLRRYTRHAIEALGLQVWAVAVRLAEQPSPTSPDADANCCSDVHYLLATLTFRPSVVAEPTNNAKVLVLHELLHLVDAHQDRVVDLLIEQLPEAERNLAHNLVTDQREQRVTRLSRMLLPLVGDPVKGGRE